MEAKMTSVRENPLLDRFEAEVVLDHTNEPTPSEEDVVSRIAAENNLDEENIQVEGIYTGFGSNTSRAELKITENFEYSENLEESSLDRAGDSPSSDDGLEKETVEEEEETGVEEVEETETEEEDGAKAEETADADYGDIVSGTISDAKDRLQELENPNWDEALEAEEQNKDRKTFKEWLESRE